MFQYRDLCAVEDNHADKVITAWMNDISDKDSDYHAYPQQWNYSYNWDKDNPNMPLLLRRINSNSNSAVKSKEEEEEEEEGGGGDDHNNVATILSSFQLDTPNSMWLTNVTQIWRNLIDYIKCYLKSRLTWD